jgi:hypothetical protein
MEMQDKLKMLESQVAILTVEKRNLRAAVRDYAAEISNITKVCISKFLVAAVNDNDCS